MSVYNSMQSSPPTLPDALSKRLRWAILASLLLNLVIWRAAAAIARHPGHFDLRPVEITRVIIDTKGHKTVKVVTKNQIKKKLAQVHVRKPPPPLKPIPHPVSARRPPPIRIAKLPPPQGAHTHTLTAPDKTAPSKSDEPPVLKGGNADVGKPIEQQNPGDAKVNPPEPVKTAPPPARPPPPPLPTTKTEPVKVAPPPPPPPPPPVKAKGPTRDAMPEDQATPEIPDDLKHGDYKSFVRVKVEIEADGSFTPILRTSSGNAEIDQRVLDALKKWKWKPALQNGVPVKSTQLFKFEFEVN